MAEPGDPSSSRDDFDDEIGFCSPRSLTGASRMPEPDTVPAQEAEVGTEADILPAAVVAENPFESAAPEPAPRAEPAAMPPPYRPPEPYRPDASHPATSPAEVEGVMGLYAVYAMILFAVPTFGASAVIGLMAVLMRARPQAPVAASHHLYQLRTLWIAAGAALAGLLLIVVNAGVFVLFVLFAWLIVRGAWGILKLKDGRAVPHPRGWWI